MVRRDGAAIRKERITEISRLVQKALCKSDDISLSKTVALFQYEFGLTRNKLMEYLTILEDLGRFTLDHENDKIRKATEREENPG